MIPHLIPIILMHAFALIFGVLAFHPIALRQVNLGYHPLLAGLLIFPRMNISRLRGKIGFRHLLSRSLLPKLSVDEVLLVDDGGYSFETAVVEAILNETVGQVEIPLRVLKSSVMALSFCF